MGNNSENFARLRAKNEVYPIDCRKLNNKEDVFFWHLFLYNFKYYHDVKDGLQD
jgi:hypothetical protein